MLGCRIQTQLGADEIVSFLPVSSSDLLVWHACKRESFASEGFVTLW